MLNIVHRHSPILILNALLLTAGCVKNRLDDPKKPEAPASLSPLGKRMDVSNTWETPPNNGLSVSGVQAPNLTISDLQLTAIDHDGAPAWVVNFECNSPLAKDACPSEGGEAQPISKMSAKAVDPLLFDGASYAQAESAFATSGVSLALSPSIGKNGGGHLSIKGLAPLAAHPNFILIIQYRDELGASYRHFRISVTPPKN